MGQINHAVAFERPAVIDAHNNTASVGQIGDPNLRAKRQRSMGGGEGALLKPFAAGGASSVEAWSIPAG